MKKRFLCLLLVLTMLICAGCAVATPQQTLPAATQAVMPTTPGETQPAQSAIEVPLELEVPRRYGMAMPYDSLPQVSGVTVTPYVPRQPQAAEGVEPYGKYHYETTVPGDLSNSVELAYSLTVSDRTVFAQGMPGGYDRDALIQWGMDPGLHVDVLHRQGFTGKGAVIAYIDQPAAMHPEYAQGNLHYTNFSGLENSMHGPTVLSMLMGKNIGTAPEAEVYFYGHASWKADYATNVQALYAIIEQNKALPEGEKITMVGFSDNIYDGKANKQAMLDAVKACEDSGVMVFFCGDYASGAFVPMADRNNYENMVPDYRYGSDDALLVPAGGRTGVCTEYGGEYVYWSSGGLSWTMPYMLGLYAIATEIQPQLTKADLLSLANSTAYQSGRYRIVNPTGFIAQVLTDAGRESEAQALLEEAAYSRHYTYAVMSKSAMSQEDLRAVETYFARLTDTTVLVVDVDGDVSAPELYKALQADAWERDGIVDGVQIFGTADMVSSFTPEYRVQMSEGIDEAGSMKSDLFFGNFLNDASLLQTYNVLDHFEQGWDVALAPCWPVARLPLEKGEYSAFFQKYHRFAADTGFAPPELVNFSNPIFAQSVHTDDMGFFLRRAETEFGILPSSYRLYGNLDGDYPVTGPVLGNFTPENLTLENQRAVCEFLINSHGQWNNIDQAIFTDGREQRISFLNTDTIDTVLAGNPYYLDCWTCENGWNMENNLTTAALNGQAVGVFSATHIISNNGVNCFAPLSELGSSNFYCFYLNYLAALHQEATRSQAFCFAQQAYAQALLLDSQNGIRLEGNYQFNLCNLLVYHNFGVLEPRVSSALTQLQGYASQSAAPGGNDAHIFEYTLGDHPLQIHGIYRTLQEDGAYLYTVDFTGDVGMHCAVFSPPNGEVFTIFGPTGNGMQQQFTFTLTPGQIEEADGIVLNFFYSDDCRALIPVEVE